MTTKPRHWAVIPAAGKGQRFGGDTPKQYLPLAGKTVIEWAVQPFVAHPSIAGIVVALAEGDTYWSRLEIHCKKPLWTITGGTRRAQSVLNALAFLKDKAADDDWTLVHDAARPCLSRDDLNRLIEALGNDAAAGILATPVSDTLKQSDGNDRILATLDREHLWCALTPQMCRYQKLYQALEAALQDGKPVTDEASALEWANETVRLVEGNAANIKITQPADLALAEKILEAIIPPAFPPNRPSPRESL